MAEVLPSVEEFLGPPPGGLPNVDEFLGPPPPIGAAPTVDQFLGPEPTKPGAPAAAPADFTDIVGGAVDKVVSLFGPAKPKVNPLSNIKALEMAEAQLWPGSPERTAYVQQQMSANPTGFLTELGRSFTGALVGANPKLVGHALEAIGVLLDSSTLEQQGSKIAAYGIHELRQFQPRVGSVSQIQRPGDVPAFIGSSMGQAFGTTMPSIITGSLTAAATANPVLGMLVGALGPSYGQNLGDVYGSAIEDREIAAKIASKELSKRTVAGTAVVAAVPIALLDAASLATFLGTSFKAAKADLMRRVVRGMATGAIVEGSTEGTQQVFSQWAQDWLGSQKDTHQKVIEFADNFFAGFFGGAAIGGAGAAFQQPEKPRPTLGAAEAQAIAALSGAGAETIMAEPRAPVPPPVAPARPRPAAEPAAQAGAAAAIEAEAIPEAQPAAFAPLELPEMPEGQRWDGVVRWHGPSEPQELEQPKVQSLLQRIKEMGGIDPSYSQDLTGESRMGVKGVPVGLFARGTWKGGKGTGLDDIATRLADEGWDIDVSDADGGVAQLSAMIREELGGQKHYSMADSERLMAWEEDQRLRQAAIDQMEAERAEPYVDAGTLAGFTDFVPAYEAQAAPEDEAIAGLYAQLADLDEGLAERIAMEADQFTQAENQRRLTDAINEAQQGVAPGRPGVGEADQVFALEAQTEQDIEREGEAERQRGEAERVAGRRARADDLRQDFTLTGSERAADEAAARGQEDLKYATAFHGSPHVWPPEPGFPHGRPRLDKIGTGEGAQAYGWGWYSAETEGVGETYSRTISSRGGWNVINSPVLKLVNAKALDALPESITSAIDAAFFAHGGEYAKRRVIEMRDKASDQVGEKRWAGIPAELRPEHRSALIDVLREADWTAKTGSLYRLDIPDDVIPKLLDWDKPLADQDWKVVRELDDAGLIHPSPGGRGWGKIAGRTIPGSGLYHQLVERKGSARAASEYLASIGIPGNKYLDQGSRGRIEPENKYFAQREDALKWAGEYGDVVDDGSKTPWREGKAGVDSAKSPQGWRAYRRGTPTFNFVVWDQKVLDRIALLERNGEKLDAMREAETRYAADQTQTPEFTPAYLAKEKQIREWVEDLARQLVPRAHVQFAKALTVSPLSRAESLPEGVGVGAAAAGTFNTRTNIITYSLTHGEEGTLQHEAIHWLRANGFFTPQEWRVLERQAKKEWTKTYRVESPEEGVAYAFGDWHVGQLAVGRDIAKLFNRLREFFERLGNLLRRAGFQTPADVFERIASGEVGARNIQTVDGIFETETGQRFSIPRYKQGIRAPATRQQAERVIDDLAADLRAARRKTGFILDQTLLATFLSSPRNAAAWHESAAPVYDLQVRQWRERDRLVSVYGREVEPFLSLRGEDAEVVNKLLEHGRLAGQVHLRGQEMGVTFILTNPPARLSKLGETITVTPKQKAGYWAARRLYSRFLADLRDVTLEEHGLPPGLTADQVRERVGPEPSLSALQASGLGIMSPEALKAVQAARTKLTAQRQEWARDKTRLEFVAGLMEQIEKARRTGYVPFMRFGDVGITVRDPKDTAGDPRGRLIDYSTIETGIFGTLAKHTFARHDARKAPHVRPMAEAVKKAYAGRGYRISEPFQLPQREMPKQVNLAEVGMLASAARIDPETWAGIIDQLDKAQAKAGFRVHFFEAKNIAGYSTDFQRATEQYIVSGASYIAQRKFRRPIREALEKINANGHHARLYTTMSDYIEYVNTPAEEFQVLRNVNFVLYLSSIASWMVNATQVQMVTVPWASRFATPARAEAEFARAVVDTTKMFSPSKGFQMFDPADAPADLREQMKRWFDDGELMPLVTLEMMGAARNRGQATEGVKKVGDVTVDIFGYGFTLAERANRISAMIMLYRLARDVPAVRSEFAKQMSNDHLAKLQVIDIWGEGATPEQRERGADAFARFGNADTNLVAGKINRARIMRGPGAPLLQFFNFPLGILELSARMAIKGGAPGAASVMLMMLLFSMLSGFPRGLPFADDIIKFVEKLYNMLNGVDRDLYWEAQEILTDHFGSQRIAQTILYGASWGLPEDHPLSVDLMRMGFGNLLPERGMDFLGVSGATVQRVPDFINEVRRDNALLALAEAFPKLAGDPLTARSWSMIGMRRKSDNAPLIPVEDVTTTDIAQKAIGFNPVKRAKAMLEARQEKRLEQEAEVVKDAFRTRQNIAYAQKERALISGDPARVAMAEEQIKSIDADIAEWNAAVPVHMQLYRQGANISAGIDAEIRGAKARDRRIPRLAREAIQKMRERRTP